MLMWNSNGEFMWQHSTSLDCSTNLCFTSSYHLNKNTLNYCRNLKIHFSFHLFPLKNKWETLFVWFNIYMIQCSKIEFIHNNFLKPEFLSSFLTGIHFCLLISAKKQKNKNQRDNDMLQLNHFKLTRTMLLWLCCINFTLHWNRELY